MLLVLRPNSIARLSLGLHFGRQVVLCLVTQSCPTLCDPMDCSPSNNPSIVVQSLSCVQLFFNPIDCSPSDFSVHGISQARKLEWVAISFSKGSSQPMDWTLVSCISRWILYHWPTREAQSWCYHTVTVRFWASWTRSLVLFTCKTGQRVSMNYSENAC